MKNRGQGVPRKDHIGKKYNRLLILENREDRIKGGCMRRYVLCRCDCGTHKEIGLSAVIYGGTKSCGCLKLEANRCATATHGVSKKPEYRVWKAMKSRCLNKNNHDYQTYGGRGIRVCKRWGKFENFFNDMGARPSDNHSLDRENNSKGYNKGNCRWATRKEQANNMRSNKHVTINGETRTIAQWLEVFPIGRGTVQVRIKRGWDNARAITEPVNQRFISNKNKTPHIDKKMVDNNKEIR